MTVEGEQAPQTALYRKYRSHSLAEVVGQSQVTDVLTRSIAKGKVAHAYLLTGPRGVGKTSIARILAHEINGLPYTDDSDHLDIIEIDAASNNGVDNVRELREKVQLAPTSAKKKVYIIDEVHMLSTAAFNALLKTLEEPPEHVVFILATTDLHKVPATIISRTQHFSFHSISVKDIVTHLKYIAEQENIKISDEALTMIAERGDGSFRDSISLLDQLSSYADSQDGISADLVQNVLGFPPHKLTKQLLKLTLEHDIQGIVSTLDNLELQGVSPTILTDQLISTVRSNLAAQPQLVKLLDKLLDVKSSSNPQLKLLTTLVAAAKPKVASAAARATAAPAPPRVIEAPVVVVETTTPTANKSKPAKKAAEPDLQPESETPKPKKKRTTKLESLDWVAFVDGTKPLEAAVFSIIKKCDFAFDGETLTIYAGSKFYKTKLDQAKYLTVLQKSLENIGADSLDIVTLAAPKPPSDEKLAKIAEMMGGGKEIKLEDDK